MEKEENLMHLLTEHSVILFIIGAVIIIALLVGAFMLFDKYYRRPRRKP